MRKICTSGSVGGEADSTNGTRYPGTKAETPDTDKREPHVELSPPIPTCVRPSSASEDRDEVSA